MGIQAGKGLESYFNDYDVGRGFLVNKLHPVMEVFFLAGTKYIYSLSFSTLYREQGMIIIGASPHCCQD